MNVSRPDSRRALWFFLFFVILIILSVWGIAELFFSSETLLENSAPIPPSEEVVLNDSTQAKVISYKIVGYFPSWALYRNPKLVPSDINANLLTHINYAFVKADADGNLALIDPWVDIEHGAEEKNEKPFLGNFGELNDLKEKFPHIKTMISIGGQTKSESFSHIAADVELRRVFVQSCIQFCEKYHFDGIDIDWEFPGSGDHQWVLEDKNNFTMLLKDLYAAAKAHNPSLFVTIAAPAGSHNYVNIELEKIAHFVDWINLMCYDFHGPWDTKNGLTNHNAPLYATELGDPHLNVDSTVRYYLSNGFPAEKIVLGMPLFGRSYVGVSGTPDGLNSHYTGPGKGTEEIGILFYSDIKQHLLPTYMRYWDDQAKVPFLYNPNVQEFISYDDEDSYRYKCQYIKQQGLGGAMVWELGQDVRPSWELLTVVHKELLGNLETALNK